MDPASFTSPSQTRFPAVARAYLAAFGFVVLATLIRLALNPVLGDALPYITYFAAVIGAAWYGGFGPAVFSVVLSCLAAGWFFFSPHHNLLTAFGDSTAIVGAVAFFLVGLTIAAASEALHRARRLALSRGESLRVTLGSIGDAVIATDDSGRVSLMNQVAEKLTGWTSTEAIGRPLQEIFRIINEQTRAVVEDPCVKVLKSGYVVGLANHTVLISRNGAEHPIDDSAAPIRNDEGQIIGVVLVFRDATEQRRAQETTERLAAIVEHSDDAIIGKRLDGTITSWNAAAERLYGFTAQEAIGQPIKMIVPADHVDELEQIMTKLRSGQRVEHLETVRLRKDGSRVDVSLTVSLIKNAYGEIVGASKVARDITQQKAAAGRLEAQREWLRVTLNSIGDAVIATDERGRVSMMNPVAETLTGWASAEVTGRPLQEVFKIINEQTRAPVEDPSAKVLKTGYIVGLANHTVLIARDGKEFPIDDSAAPIRSAEGCILGVVVVFRDATQERQSQELNERLAAIVEFADDAIIGKRLDGTITSWNAAAERLYGIKAAEAIGKSIRIIVPDDRIKELDEIMARLRAGERIDHLDTVRLRKDGSRVDVSLTISPIKNRYGEVIGSSKITRDISQRKRADRQKDEFLAMLSHELRNPIAAIAYAAELFKVSGSDAPDAAQIIERQVRHLSRLIDDLLDVSRITRNKIQLRKEPIDAATLARRAATTIQPMADQNGHQVIVDLASQEMSLFVDPTRIEQVLVNLLTNAVKYTPRGGRIELSAHREDHQVAFKVKDTGVGIPTAMLPRVFELFTQLDPTLDRSQGGLGIGLTVVRQLTEMHGGSVSATSDGPGKGCEFVVRLPLDSEAATASAAPTHPSAVPPGLKVLIVEDSVDTAQSIARLLERSGCLTQQVYDGHGAVRAALELCPDVVLLDIGLPGQSGYQVAQQIRQHPQLANLQLIAISGYDQQQDRERSVEAGFDHHLVKPIDFPELLALLTATASKRAPRPGP